MPSFLVLHLQAPLVAYGDVMIDQRGPVRSLPAASTLTGLLGNALGYRREDSARLGRLQERLTFGCRQDIPGERFTEYQTAELFREDEGWTTWGHVEDRGGGSWSKGPDGRDRMTHQRWRQHDVGSVVTVVLTLDPADEEPDLARVAAALDEPFRPLFLGRKSCLPDTYLSRGVIESPGVWEALCGLPLAQAKVVTRQREVRATVLVSLPEGTEAPAGFREVRLSERRNWMAGIHTGEEARWLGDVPVEVFPKAEAVLQ